MKPEELDPDDLIGAVKYENRWRFFGGAAAEWILDCVPRDIASIWRRDRIH